MKKITLIIMLMISFITLAQENSIIAETSIDTSNSSIEEVIKPYVIDFLETSKDVARKGYEIAQEEIPIIIKQWLMFELIDKLLSIFLTFFIFILIGRFLLNMAKLEEKDYNESISSDDRSKYYKLKNKKYIYKGLNIAIRILQYGPGIIVLSATITNIIKLLFFQKLYLVEQFINVIN